MKRISYERLSGNTYVNRAPSAGANQGKQENGRSSPFHSGNSPWASFHPRWHRAFEFVQVSHLGSQLTGEGMTGLSPVSVKGMGARDAAGRRQPRRAGRVRCAAQATGSAWSGPPSGFREPCVPAGMTTLPSAGEAQSSRPTRNQWPRTMAGNMVGTRKAYLPSL